MEFAKSNQMIWSQVSAKEGTGIESMFKKVAEKVCAIKHGSSNKPGGAAANTF